MTIPLGGGSSTSTNPNIFNTGSVSVADTTGSTYNVFSLPAHMGEQQIFLGYAPGHGKPNHGGGFANGLLGSDSNMSGNKAIDMYQQQSNQYSSVTDLMKQFADMARSDNPLQKKSWEYTQAQLQAMGKYGASKSINYGGWGSADENALQGAFSDYLASGAGSQMQTFAEFVEQQAKSGTANGLDQNQDPGSSGSQRAPITLTDPTEIASAGDQSAQSELGRALSPEEQAQLVGQEHGQEQAQYDAAGAGQTNTSADPSTIARQFAVEHNLPEYAAHQAESFMNLFANMFLTGSSARANTSVGDMAVGDK